MGMSSEAASDLELACYQGPEGCGPQRTAMRTQTQELTFGFFEIPALDPRSDAVDSCVEAPSAGIYEALRLDTSHAIHGGERFE
ncbi:MAG TPA: hypothetical protein VNB06_23745 [Thermoanaerobaculia bacterium]|nr:hypothetical protein [Thermoanaerobaculia bacterium]